MNEPTREQYRQALTDLAMFVGFKNPDESTTPEVFKARIIEGFVSMLKAVAHSREKLEADCAAMREALTETENALRAERDTSALYRSQLHALAGLARSYHDAVMLSYVAQCDYRGDNSAENAAAVSEASCAEVDTLEAMEGLIKQLTLSTTAGAEMLEKAKKADDWLDTLRAIYERLGIKEGDVPGDEKVGVTVKRYVDRVVENSDRLAAALRVADDRLHKICGTYMALAHGEPDSELMAAIHSMGDDMNKVREALAAHRKGEKQ